MIEPCSVVYFSTIFPTYDWQNCKARLPLVSHSEEKGHVPNQSLYKGWEQSFPQLSHDQKMDIISCQDGQFSKCRNEICFLLVRF